MHVPAVINPLLALAVFEMAHKGALARERLHALRAEERIREMHVDVFLEVLVVPCLVLTPTNGASLGAVKTDL